MSVSEEVREIESENQKLKEEVERLKIICGEEWKTMKCENCKLFRQYYVKCGSNYFGINEGSCVAGRRFKKKRAEDDKCRFFESRNI